MSGLRRRRPCRGNDLPDGVVSVSLPTPYPVGPVTVYLLEGDPPTLIDTGPATGAAWRRLCSELLDLGYRPEDIGAVLITHGHHDHFGNSSRLAGLGAQVMAHPDDALNFTMTRCYAARWRHLRRAGMGVARRAAVLFALRMLDRTTRPLVGFRPLHDGQELTLSGRALRVHHTPGHSPGHVAFELVGEGVLVSGDTVLDGITPNAVVDIDPRDRGRLFLSLAAYRSTLRRLAELRPRALLPAHGPCLRDVDRQIDRIGQHQDERAGEVTVLLHGRRWTTTELVDRLFPRVSLLGAFLAYSEVLGHLLELERCGVARRESHGNRDLWCQATTS
jgi:glyoxylase-like metal-dependent hydrolase (beta-lactamase superfamily II)